MGALPTPSDPVQLMLHDAKYILEFAALVGLTANVRIIDPGVLYKVDTMYAALRSEYLYAPEMLGRIRNEIAPAGRPPRPSLLRSSEQSVHSRPFTHSTGAAGAAHSFPRQPSTYDLRTWCQGGHDGDPVLNAAALDVPVPHAQEDSPTMLVLVLDRSSESTQEH